MKLASAYIYKSERNKLMITGLVIYSMSLVFLPSFGHAWDNACWGMWSTRMTSHGFASAYTEGSTVNYLPLYLYVLKAYGEWMGTEQIFAHTYYLKAVTLLFDVASAYLICSRLSGIKNSWRYMIFLFLNIGFIYNSFVWNQVDGILSFFVLWAFFMAMEDRLELSILAYVLALNFKLQAVLFAPVLGIFWIRIFKLRSFTIGLLVSIAAEFIILLPFIQAGVVMNIGDVIKGSVDYYKSISMNAFNLWHILLNGDLFFRKDDAVFILGLSYRNFGLILFMISSAFVCVPLLLRVIKKFRNKSSIDIDPETGALAMALIVLSFFYFNTQMHERYIHPVMVFSSFLAFRYKHWAQWIIISLAYALSLEKVCMWLHLNNYGTLVFNEKFLAGLYTIGLLLLFLAYAKRITRKAERITHNAER